MRRKVAITGVGLVSPLGVGTALTWEGVIEGRSAARTITRFDASDFTTTFAGEIEGFDPAPYVAKKEIKKCDLFIQYALAASQLAIEDSGFEVNDDNRDRVAVILGAGIGGMPLIESTHKVMLEKGPSRVSPFFIPGLIANMAAGQVSIKLGARGPNASPCSACTTGLHAIGDAFRLIQHGYADAAVTGGAEGPITPLSLAGFCSMRALSTRNHDPGGASRPWDKERDGFVLAEGSGVVILEELQAARARGAEIYAEIVGYGMSGDAYHISAPHPEGEGSRRVMVAALEDASLDPTDIAYINAHGTSTSLGDLSEVIAIKNVFGDHAYKLSVSSTKSSTGHLLGAAGGLEGGILALALRNQIMPPTINLEDPDEGCDLDFVPGSARDAEMEYALTNSFGFGGTNGTVILKRAG